ncbi:MAG: hypothetical protein JST54_30125 [Deltaproteobacteria bacterium]|nr:hypothetical protein [Deltaproteobacteria bacterium]
MDLAIVGQLAHLILCVGAAAWVGRTLYKHGRVFLVDAFAGNTELADAVNHLLVVGFYLINIGYVFETLNGWYRAADAMSTVGMVGDKVGTVLLVLGAMHFFNLFVFSRIRRRALIRHAPPPVAPTQILTATARIA